MHKPKLKNVHRFVLSAVRGKLLERERKKERQTRSEREKERESNK